MLPDIYDTISQFKSYGVVFGVVLSCDKQHLFILAQDYGITIYDIK